MARCKHSPEAWQAWRERNGYVPSLQVRKEAAQGAVADALRTGKLVRGSCTLCGAHKTHGHHTSYEFEHWLHVVWLCPKHHGEVHRIGRQIAQTRTNIEHVLRDGALRITDLRVSKQVQ